MKQQLVEEKPNQNVIAATSVGGELKPLFLSGDVKSQTKTPSQNLANYDSLNLKDKKKSDKIFRQKKFIADMMKEFTFEINKGKSMDKKEYQDKLLTLLDMKLFGYLSSQKYYEDQNSAKPFRSQLISTKKNASMDILKISDVVDKWKIINNKVFINNDLSFSPRKEVFTFFKKLQWLKRYKGGNKRDQNYLQEEINRIFGTYPGETKNFGQMWDPDRITRLLMESTEDEAVMTAIDKEVADARLKSSMSDFSIQKQANSFQKLRSTAYSKTIIAPAKKKLITPMQIDFGYIATPAQKAVSMINSVSMSKQVDYKSWSIDNEGGKAEEFSFQDYNLKAEKVYKSEQYGEQIPSDQMRGLKSFIKNITSGIQRKVPFLLRPELFTITGPVEMSVRNEIIKTPDPVIVLIFNEFPSHIIPIVFWLPAGFNLHSFQK